MLVAIVCDGAGSAPRSDVGSRLCCEAFLENVTAFLRKGGTVASIDREVVGQWVRSVADALAACANREGTRRSDYACTMVATVVGRDVAALVQVGDGAQVLRLAGGTGWMLPLLPQRGTYANETTFVTTPTAIDTFGFARVEGVVESVAVFSDGIERMVLDSVTHVANARFFDHVIAPVALSDARGLDVALSAGLAAYLASPMVNARTDDDKSLVLATRRPCP